MPAKKKQQQMAPKMDDTSIPKTIRRILAMCPKQELRPVRLTAWAEELVLESRRNGIADRQIKYWIEEFATAGYWSAAQIDTVLRDNGFKEPSGGGSGGSNHERRFAIDDLQELMESMTGLDEAELIRADKREDLEKKSSRHILDTEVRLSEFEINHWIAELSKLATIIDIYLDTLKRRKMELKRNVLTT
jgi:hypothetical protein